MILLVIIQKLHKNDIKNCHPCGISGCSVWDRVPFPTIKQIVKYKCAMSKQGANEKEVKFTLTLALMKKSENKTVNATDC